MTTERPNDVHIDDLKDPVLTDVIVTALAQLSLPGAPGTSGTVTKSGEPGLKRPISTSLAPPSVGDSVDSKRKL